MKKKILFITGTRADFGKLKTLIQSVELSNFFDVGIFITGMHTLSKYGYTVDEVYKSIPEHRLQDGTRSVYVFHNQVLGEPMERILASTIDGLSRYLTEFVPDLIVVHGDRVEALAGAIVGALKNILVAHLEGGEVSGTIDELIRHSITKMSHVHFVANESASKRLIQLGEKKENVYIIGSPDIDLMMSKNLPQISEVKSYYEIPFEEYGVVIFHPVTTDIIDTRKCADAIANSVLESNKKHVVIFPNNDPGCEEIFKAWEKFKNSNNIVILPSMRVEYFLILLKNAKYLLGNSSAGIRECPVYGINAINVSSRQNGRFESPCISNVDGDKDNILQKIFESWNLSKRYPRNLNFGKGNSAELFMNVITKKNFWEKTTQKQFNDVF